ncbi:hypothetical protein NKI72_26730 [Mesorhizobium sp. M0437]|uniref:hypothetical protein n=1 Tax=Mesorhizobium sp. M0437 TaxID=2956945 RepID=UPI003336196A
MTYLFLFFAFGALAGILHNSLRRNGHGMAYSAVMLVIWIVAALWWSGRVG